MKVKLSPLVLWYKLWPLYLQMRAFGVNQLGTGGPQRCSEYADEEKYSFLLQRCKYTVISIVSAN
jgi:hypothetical protein